MHDVKLLAVLVQDQLLWLKWTYLIFDPPLNERPLCPTNQRDAAEKAATNCCIETSCTGLHDAFVQSMGLCDMLHDTRYEASHRYLCSLSGSPDLDGYRYRAPKMNEHRPRNLYQSKMGTDNFDMFHDMFVH